MTQKQMTNLLFLKTHLLYLKLHLHLVGNAAMGNCPYFLLGKLAPSIKRERESEGKKNFCLSNSTTTRKHILG